MPTRPTAPRCRVSRCGCSTSATRWWRRRRPTTTGRGEWSPCRPVATARSTWCRRVMSRCCWARRSMQPSTAPWSPMSPRSTSPPRPAPRPTSSRAVSRRSDWSLTLTRPVAMAGTAWVDDDGDAVRDASEGGLTGATVTLHDAAGSVVGVMTTADDGRWWFDDVLPGSYQVTVHAPAGHRVWRTGSTSGAGAVTFDPASDPRATRWATRRCGRRRRARSTDGCGTTTTATAGWCPAIAGR